MKPRVFSLAVLLLAGAASGALAQDYGRRDGDRSPAQQQDGAVRGRQWQGQAREGQAWRSQGQVQDRPGPAQPQAQPAPQAPPRQEVRPLGPREPHGPQAERRSEDRGGQPQVRPLGPREPHVVEGVPRVEDRGDRTPDRREQTWRDHNWRNPEGRNQDRQGWDRGDRDRRPDGVRDRDDRRQGGGWNGGREWNRDRDRDRDWDRDWDRNGGRDRRDRPHWEPHRYPPIYNSPSRYRGAPWRPPRGYYVRAWQFGEILPGGWYQPEYRILDWWEYDLPEPPYGYDWIRIGRDALLIDEETGRIVQVVRLVFW